MFGFLFSCFIGQEDKKSAVQKPKHWLTWDFLSALVSFPDDAFPPKVVLDTFSPSSEDYLEDAEDGILDYAVSGQHLRLALRELGQISGKVSSEQILDVIFADFCIGKWPEYLEYFLILLESAICSLSNRHGWQIETMQRNIRLLATRYWHLTNTSASAHNINHVSSSAICTLQCLLFLSDIAQMYVGWRTWHMPFHSCTEHQRLPDIKRTCVFAYLDMLLCVIPLDAW